MGINKKYKRYKAFQYLKPGTDYRAFELCDGDKVFPGYLIELNNEQKMRLNRIAREKVCISLHDHPILNPKNLAAELNEYNREGRQHCAYEALSRSYWDCIFDNLMDGTNQINSKCGWKWSEVIHDLGIRLCDLAQQDFIIRCGKVEDIYMAHNEGKIALVFAIEGAAPIENELDRIEIMYGFGVRVLGITYSESNALGSGCKEERDGGLTVFGKQVVERMNKVGMAIDCSHVGSETTKDVIKYSKKPIFLTHIGARALWNFKRLAPDDVLKACADKGGVIGIEAAPHTTLTKRYPDHSIYSYMEHFEYVKNLVGIDHVAFGPDTVYGDHVGVHHVCDANLSTEENQGDSNDYKEVAYVKGIENSTEASKNILRFLIKAGYSDEDIGKVIGGNILRVLKEVWV